MGFEIPRLNVCCCGLALKSGVYIIGVLNLLLLLPIASISFTTEVKYLFKGEPMTTVGFFESDLATFDVISRVTLVFFLIYGCYKENPSYMLGFFLLQVVFILVFILFILYYLFLHIYGIPSGSIFFYTFITALQGYSATIVFNHYRNLKEGRIT